MSQNDDQSCIDVKKAQAKKYATVKNSRTSFNVYGSLLEHDALFP